MVCTVSMLAAATTWAVRAEKHLITAVYAETSDESSFNSDARCVIIRFKHHVCVTQVVFGFTCGTSSTATRVSTVRASTIGPTSTEAYRGIHGHTEAYMGTHTDEYTGAVPGERVQSHLLVTRPSLSVIFNAVPGRQRVAQ